MNHFLQRLDTYGTDDRWRKPRHGDCNVCERAVIDHPCWPHRWHALLDMVAERM